VDGKEVEFHGLDEPVCLVNAPSEQAVERIDERLDVKDGAWRHYCKGTGRDTWGAEVYWDGGFATQISYDGSAPRHVWRSRVVDAVDSMQGVLAGYERVRRQIQVLARFAKAQNSWAENTDGSWSAVVDLRDAYILDSFGNATLGNGVIVTPGPAELRLSRAWGEVVLSVSYRDCMNVELHTDRLSWRDEGGFPSRIERIDWTAGAGEPLFVVSHESVPSARQRATLFDGSDLPAGIFVEDNRFDVPLHYAAAEGLPSDMELLGEALSQGSLIQLDLSEGKSSGDIPARLPLEQVASSHLGSFHLGDRLVVSVPVRNYSDDVLIMSGVAQPCDTQNSVVDPMIVRPGMTSRLHSSIHITDVGKKEYVFGVTYEPYEGGSPRTTTVRLSLDSVAYKGLEPKLQFARVGHPCRVKLGDLQEISDLEIEPAGITKEIRGGGEMGLIVGDPSAFDLGVTVAQIKPRNVRSSGAHVLFVRPADEPGWPDPVHMLAGAFPRNLKLQFPEDVTTAELVQIELPGCSKPSGPPILSLHSSADSVEVMQGEPSRGGQPSAFMLKAALAVPDRAMSILLVVFP